MRWLRPVEVPVSLLSVLLQGAQGCLILPSVRGHREGARGQGSLLRWVVNVNPDRWQERRPRERRGPPCGVSVVKTLREEGSPVNVFVIVILRPGRRQLKKTGINYLYYRLFLHLIFASAVRFG